MFIHKLVYCIERETLEKPRVNQNLDSHWEINYSKIWYNPSNKFEVHSYNAYFVRGISLRYLRNAHS